MTPRLALVLVALVALAGCQSDGSPGSTTRADERFCDLPGFDLAALGVHPGSAGEVVRSVAERVLDVGQPEVQQATTCSFVVSGGDLEPVQVLVSRSDGRYQLAGITSPQSRSVDVPMSFSLVGVHLRLRSQLWCSGCASGEVYATSDGPAERATVKATPIVVELDYPPGATHRGVLLLVKDEVGQVRDARATVLPDGDSAAG